MSKITWKLSYFVEIEAKLEVNDLLEIQSLNALSNSHQRKSVRQMMSEKLSNKQETQTNEKICNPKYTRRVSVTPNIEKDGVPTTSLEIQGDISTGFSAEMFYIQKHAETAIKELIEGLVAESHGIPINYEIPEGEAEKLENVNQISKEFEIGSKKKNRRILQKMDSSMRKRMNPSNTRRPPKSEDEKLKEKNDTEQRIIQVLINLIQDSEKLTRAEVLRRLNPRVKQNHTAYLNNRLKSLEINWEELVLKAKKLAKN